MDLYSKLLSFDISQYDMVVIKIYNHSGYMVDFAEFIFADIINYKEKLSNCLLKTLHIQRNCNHKIYQIEAINLLYK